MPRRCTATLTVLAVAIAACGTPDPGVEAGRSDRTQDANEPAPATIDVAPTATTGDTTPPESPSTEPTATDPPATEPPAVTTTTATTTTAPDRPPGPAASGPGSVSADDLDSILLPTNPALLGPSAELVDGRDAPRFLDEEMTFTGMDPVIEIAGAPITLWSYFVGAPEFDGDGTPTAAGRLSVGYRMAVEVENDDIDGFAEQLRNELRPLVEAANPGEPVTDTLDEAPLGNGIFGLVVGPVTSPTTRIEIQQHYVIVPRPVNDLLLAVLVTRSVDAPDLDPSELPTRDLLVDDALDAQIDLFEQIEAPVDPPVLLSHRILANIPSAGVPTVNRFAGYDVTLPADGFENYVTTFGAALESGDYAGVENFGDTRTFDHGEQRNDSEFIVTRDGDDGATVGIQGDIVAYPG